MFGFIMTILPVYSSNIMSKITIDIIPSIHSFIMCLVALLMKLKRHKFMIQSIGILTKTTRFSHHEKGQCSKIHTG